MLSHGTRINFLHFSCRMELEITVTIAVIEVISGLAYKRGEICVDPFASFVCFFKHKNI